ncbi:hypothetical protein AVEN_232686-1 [Araneus ventricosus]|uniref:Uncharacterized protein n=1 Tax=Araneus ventricosus TaxID=182803 RepID=A0A4Y2HE26_ARAVE|nr:hypothetical protein AVEN_232686-1 [Araneus ventricosus]
MKRYLARISVKNRTCEIRICLVAISKIVTSRNVKKWSAYLIYPSCCHNAHLKGLDCNSRHTLCDLADDKLEQALVIRRLRPSNIGGKDFLASSNEFSVFCTRHYVKMSLHEKRAHPYHTFKECGLNL